MFSWFILNILKHGKKIKRIIELLLSSYHVTVMIRNSWAFVSSSSSPSFEVSSFIAFLLGQIFVTNHISLILDKKSIFNSNSTSNTFHNETDLLSQCKMYFDNYGLTRVKYIRKTYMSNCVNALSGYQNISDSLYQFVFIRVDIFCLNQQQQIFWRLEITSHLRAVN